MKNTIMAVVLAFGFALPISSAAADPWYGVENNQDGRVEIRTRAHGEGRVSCVIPVGEILHRNHEQNWSRYIHVEWKRPSGRHWEWEFKDARNYWCRIWDRRGWVDKQDPDLVVIPRPHL